MGKVIYVKFGDGLVVSNINEDRTAVTDLSGFDTVMLTGKGNFDRAGGNNNWCALDAAVQRLMDGLRSETLPRFRSPSSQVTPENE